MYENRLKAVSFLPLEDHKYQQAPYESIDEKTYEKMIKNLKKPKLTIEDEDRNLEVFCDGERCEILS